MVVLPGLVPRRPRWRDAGRDEPPSPGSPRVIARNPEAACRPGGGRAPSAPGSEIRPLAASIRRWDTPPGVRVNVVFLSPKTSASTSAALKKAPGDVPVSLFCPFSGDFFFPFVILCQRFQTKARLRGVRQALDRA